MQNQYYLPNDRYIALYGQPSPSDLVCIQYNELRDMAAKWGKSVSEVRALYRYATDEEIAKYGKRKAMSCLTLIQAVKRCASCISKANYSGRVAIYKCSDGYGYGVAEYHNAEDSNGEHELFSLRTSPGSNEPAANIEAYIRSVLRV